MSEREPLIAQLLDMSVSFFTRAEAAAKLGRMGDPEAIGALAGAAKDEEPYVREKAVVALGELGGACAVPPLVAALSDDSSAIRRYAAAALGKIAEPGAIGALKELQQDRSWSVSQAANEALEAIRKKYPDAFLAAAPEPGPDAQEQPPVQAEEVADAQPIPLKPVEPKPAGKPYEAEPAEAPKEPSSDPKPPTELKPLAPPRPLAPPPAEARQPHPPPAPRPQAQSRRGMTKDELVEAALRGTDIHQGRSGEALLFRVPLPAGRHQDVQLLFRRNDGGEEIVSLFTTCGPAVRANYEWALRMNPKLPCGAIGLIELGRKMSFVMSECLLLSETTPRELRRALTGVATRGDWLEKQLTGRDQL